MALLEPTRLKQQEYPIQLLIVRKSSGGTNIHKHNAAGQYIQVEAGSSPWSPQGITKPEINSNWKKNSSGPNCLQAVHMGWNGEGVGGYSWKMPKINTYYYNSFNKNPQALIIGSIMEVRGAKPPWSTARLLLLLLDIRPFF